MIDLAADPAEAHPTPGDSAAVRALAEQMLAAQPATEDDAELMEMLEKAGYVEQ